MTPTTQATNDTKRKNERISKLRTTSAMVITKFVYRHSWKTNIINIKAFKRDSIKIMKLTSEQIEEIKEQQSQQNISQIHKEEL